MEISDQTHRYQTKLTEAPAKGGSAWKEGMGFTTDDQKVIRN